MGRILVNGLNAKEWVVLSNDVNGNGMGRILGICQGRLA